MIRRVLLSALVSVCCAAPVFAQQEGQATTSGVDFFPESNFFVNAEHLSTDSIHYKWRADFHGEADIVHWAHGGRFTFQGNYEAVLGNFYRRFDPEQGNYLLQGVAAQRVGPIDVGLVFHHTSRHVSDRFKPFAVDWNSVGVEVRKRLTVGRVDLTLQGDVRHVVEHSLVDYTNETLGRATVVYHWRPRIGVVADTQVRMVSVDGSRNRGSQGEYRVEGGVRLGGKGGATELFLAAERRLDADVMALGPRSWFAAGFRLRGR